MIDPDVTQIIAALLVGAGLGILVQRARFCMVATFGNLFSIGDWRHAQALALALAVAMLGTQVLEYFELAAIGSSFYRLNALPLGSALAGGLLFGFGATLAGGCAARLLIRSAEGSLGAVMILAIAITSAALLEWITGPAAPLQSSSWSLQGGLAERLGIATPYPPLALIGALLTMLWLTRRQWRTDLLLAGAASGALAVLAWWIESWQPTAQAAQAINLIPAEVDWLYRIAGLATQTTSLTLWLPLGMMIGALLSALQQRHFKWTRPSASAMRTQAAGALCMGSGVYLIGADNLGHGLSGAATLAVASLITLAAMIGGIGLGTLWWSRRL